MTQTSDGFEKSALAVSKQLREYASFSGSGEELLSLVGRLAAILHLAPDDDSGNERLLRHYASVNVVDKPNRQGRDAVYTYRHLLQFLTARRLMKQGFALSKIAEFTSVVPTETLQQTLCESPQRSEAELLVAAYKAAGVASVGQAATRTTSQIFPGDLALPGSPPRPEQMYGMADVMHEIEKIRARFAIEFQEMQLRMHRSLNALENTSEKLNRLQMDSAKSSHWALEEGRTSLLRLEDRILALADMTAQLTYRFEAQLCEVTERSKSIEERLAVITATIGQMRSDLLSLSKK